MLKRLITINKLLSMAKNQHIREYLLKKAADKRHLMGLHGDNWIEHINDEVEE